MPILDINFWCYLIILYYVFILFVTKCAYKVLNYYFLGKKHILMKWKRKQAKIEINWCARNKTEKSLLNYNWANGHIFSIFQTYMMTHKSIKDSQDVLETRKKLGQFLCEGHFSKSTCSISKISLEYGP